MVMRMALALAVLLGGCGDDGGGETLPDATSPDALVCQPPTHFTFSAVGDRSFASFGWTGFVHNVRVPDETPFGVEVTTCDAGRRVSPRGRWLEVRTRAWSSVPKAKRSTPTNTVVCRW